MNPKLVILSGMRKLITLSVLLLFVAGLRGQTSDYLAIRTKKDRPMKTYYAGGFISAETYDGFRINGYITAIRNDSIIILQEETRLMGTEFGSRVDTLKYMVGVLYNQIRKFNFGKGYVGGRKKGFSEITIPRLMVVGGVGFMGLELVNTAYRQEKLFTQDKMTSLGIAAAVAGTGILWSHIKKKREKVGGKYKAVYIKAGSETRPK